MRSALVRLASVVALAFGPLLAGCGSPSLLITPVSNTNTLVESQVQPGRGGWMNRDRVAVIEVEGMISNSRTSGLLSPGENKVSLFAQQLDQAERDGRVKAVVLRVNSPGGTVTGSDTIYELIQRFRRRTGKPVVASAQEVTASGAFYIACAADQIVVQPTSVVGSIGVVYNTFEFSGALSKLGVREEAIKSGKYKDMGSPFKPLPNDERALMQAMVDEYYARFMQIVRSRRPSVDAATLAIATDGRVFSGTQAVSWGLADRTGLLADAIDVARQLGNAPNARAVMYRRPYGYAGSIYASSEMPAPQANATQLVLPESVSPLPGGFYYVWQGGR